TLLGQAGNDNLLAGAGNDSLDGGDDNDTLTAGAGTNLIAGGAGVDKLVEAGDGNFALTNTSLTGLGSDVLSGIELASLTGGPGDNQFNLQGWTGTATVDGAAGTDALSVSGTGGADTPAITESQVTFGASTTTFANVEHVAVFGGGGDDLF